MRANEVIEMEPSLSGGGQVKITFSTVEFTVAGCQMNWRRPVWWQQQQSITYWHSN